MSIFKNIVGQESVKRRLSFYLEAFHKTGQSVNLFVGSEKVAGKTEIIKTFAKGYGWKHLLINSSTIKSVDAFFNQIIQPFVMKGNVVVSFDEAHDLDISIVNMLLSALAPNRENKNIVRFKDRDVVFDFSKVAFNFLTTNMEKIFPPLLDRLEVIMLEEYTNENLIDIVKSYTVPSFSGDSIQAVPFYLRKNPRSAVNLAKEINKFAAINNLTHFNACHLIELAQILSLRPYGLNAAEIQVLSALYNHGNMTLSALAAKLGMQPITVRTGVEPYLLRNNLIAVDGKRIITQEGINVLAKI